MRIQIAVTAVIAGVALAGCSSSSTTSPTTAPATPTATATASADSSVGCDTAQVSGTTSNAKLQALGMSVYDSLDCSNPEPMAAQAKAIATSPGLAAKVKAIDGTVTGSAISGAYSIQLVVLSDRSTCQILGVDSPVRGKSITCGNA